MRVPEPQVISWPLEGIGEDGRMHFTRDDQSVREVIRNILLTRPGERLMRRQFGAGLMDFVHQPNNQTTRNLMAGVVKKAIEQWETRVKVEAVTVLPDNTNPTTVHIVIRYVMRFSGQMHELSLGLQLAA